MARAGHRRRGRAAAGPDDPRGHPGRRASARRTARLFRWRTRSKARSAPPWTRSPSTPNGLVAGEFDHAIRQALIAREEIELDAVEAVSSHPQPARAMRALPARALSRRRHELRRLDGRGGPPGLRVRERPWRRWARASPPRFTAAGSSAMESRTSRTTSLGSPGSPRRRECGPSPSRARPGGRRCLLGARRGPPGRASRRALWSSRTARST